MPAVWLVLSLLIPFILSAFLPKGFVTRHFRLTHNLTPKIFVNDSISSDHSRVIVMPLLRMLSTILTPLVDVFQAKTDIKSAFQIIPVRPQDYNL